MELQEVTQKIHKIIAEQLGVKESEVVDTATLEDDLGADSLDLVELVMEVEEEFEIELPDNLFEDEDGGYLTECTVGKFIEIVAKEIQ